jgi:lysozyme
MSNPRVRINPKIVDLYHGDRVTDFAAAYAFGIRGVIHKATQGTGIADPAYAARRKLAADAGILWGAYHFNSGDDPARQAKHFLSVAEPDAKTLLALDFEDIHPEMSLADARAFLEAVSAATGRRPILYSGNRIKETICGAAEETRIFFAAHPLWLAEYGTAPHLRDADGQALPWPNLFLWQFTGDGAGPQPHAVPGIGGKVDINSFDGSDADLAALWPGSALASGATAP